MIKFHDFLGNLLKLGDDDGVPYHHPGQNSSAFTPSPKLSTASKAARIFKKYLINFGNAQFFR